MEYNKTNPLKEILNNKKVFHNNRGMNLEADLNATNEYYRNMDIGVIYKKPTPITIVKVDYPSRYEAVIKEDKPNTNIK